ncbi:MAG: class I SAM-dependent methyltransferase, partial [Myxococcota bacterium]
FVRFDMDSESKIARYREFFTFCEKHLVPGGRLSLQTIGYGTMPGGRANQFIVDRIFPGSDLPFLSEIAAASHGVLTIEDLENRPEQYAWTCSRWAQRLKARLPEAEKIVGSERSRDWYKFLKLSVAGFQTGALTLYRIVFRKPVRPGALVSLW